MCYSESSKVTTYHMLLTLHLTTSASSVKNIINVYRSFNPQGNVNARAKFGYQIEIIKNAMN